MRKWLLNFPAMSLADEIQTCPPSSETIPGGCWDIPKDPTGNELAIRVYTWDHLTTDKGWSLREIRREGATLEDFFLQVTAKQQEQRVR